MPLSISSNNKSIYSFLKEHSSFKVGDSFFYLKIGPKDIKNFFTASRDETIELFLHNPRWLSRHTELFPTLLKELLEDHSEQGKKLLNLLLTQLKVEEFASNFFNDESPVLRINLLKELVRAKRFDLLEELATKNKLTDYEKSELMHFSIPQTLKWTLFPIAQSATHISTFLEKKDFTNLYSFLNTHFFTPTKNEQILEDLMKAWKEMPSSYSQSSHTLIKCIVLMGKKVPEFSSINEKNDNGETLFIEAIKQKDFQLIEDLLQLGADYNCKSENQKSPLEFAVETQDDSIIKKLYELNIDHEFGSMSKEDRIEFLLESIKANQSPKVIQLIKQGLLSDKEKAELLLRIESNNFQKKEKGLYAALKPKQDLSTVHSVEEIINRQKILIQQKDYHQLRENFKGFEEVNLLGPFEKTQLKNLLQKDLEALESCYPLQKKYLNECLTELK